MAYVSTINLVTNEWESSNALQDALTRIAALEALVGG